MQLDDALCNAAYIENAEAFRPLAKGRSGHSARSWDFVRKRTFRTADGREVFLIFSGTRRRVTRHRNLYPGGYWRGLRPCRLGRIWQLVHWRAVMRFCDGRL